MSALDYTTGIGATGPTGVTGATGATGVGSPSDGWVDDSANTWTFASASTFTVAGDRTAEFTPGTRLRFTQTTVKYGTVASSSHAAGTTTVTIIVNTDYVLANAAISVNSYSYEANPQGYPGWFNYLPTLTGWSGTPTITHARFCVIGRVCHVTISVGGTSNATSTVITGPVPAPRANAILAFTYGTNNGAALANGGVFNNSGANTNVQVYSSPILGAWTASGSKSVIGTYSHEF